MKKLLLIFLSLFIITTLTGCGTAKTTTTAPDNTPKTAEDKKLMEEIKQHDNLTDADIAKIQSDAEKRAKDFIAADEVHKNYEKSKQTNPNADYYRITAK